MVVAFAHYCVRVSWENFLFGYPENAGIFFSLFVYGWIHLDFCFALSFFSVCLERDS